MSLPNHLLNLPCTITRRSTTAARNAKGKKILAETRVETVCYLEKQQRRADEEPDGQAELSDTLWLLVLPVGTEIDNGDLVAVNGDEYELSGAPWTVRNPRTQADSHVEATLRRTAGPEAGS